MKKMKKKKKNNWAKRKLCILEPVGLLLAVYVCITTCNWFCEGLSTVCGYNCTIGSHSHVCDLGLSVHAVYICGLTITTICAVLVTVYCTVLIPGYVHVVVTLCC